MRIIKKPMIFGGETYDDGYSIHLWEGGPAIAVYCLPFAPNEPRIYSDGAKAWSLEETENYTKALIVACVIGRNWDTLVPGNEVMGILIEKE